MSGLIGRYTPKPCVIEAIQWDGTLLSALQIREAYRDGKTDPASEIIVWRTPTTKRGQEGLIAEEPVTLQIKTLEGVMDASPEDFIVRGLRGELYPCKPDVFAAKYEREALPAEGFGHWADRVPDGAEAVPVVSDLRRMQEAVEPEADGAFTTGAFPQCETTTEKLEAVRGPMETAGQSIGMVASREGIRIVRS